MGILAPNLTPVPKGFIIEFLVVKGTCKHTLTQICMQKAIPSVANF